VTSGTRSLLLALAANSLLAACSKKEPPPPPPPPPAPVVVEAPRPPPFQVTGLELGTRLGPDKKIVSPATSFVRTESTIYLSVASVGAAPSVNLKARWTYGDKEQLVNETSMAIAPTGPAQTEFQIAKKGPWPAGKYKVVVTADGAAAGAKDFEIK